jgi:hypothetical protein
MSLVCAYIHKHVCMHVVASQCDTHFNAGAPQACTTASCSVRLFANSQNYKLRICGLLGPEVSGKLNKELQWFQSSSRRLPSLRKLLGKLVNDVHARGANECRLPKLPKLSGKLEARQKRIPAHAQMLQTAQAAEAIR